MIEAARQIKVQETAGVVAVVALGVSGGVEYGFSDRGNAVVATAAVAENLLMVHEIYTDESLRAGAVAGDTVVAGGNVALHFRRDRGEIAAVTVRTVIG